MMPSDCGDGGEDEAVTEPKGIAENKIPPWKKGDVVGPWTETMSETEGSYEVLGNV